MQLSAKGQRGDANGQCKVCLDTRTGDYAGRVGHFGMVVVIRIENGQSAERMIAKCFIQSAPICRYLRCPHCPRRLALSSVTGWSNQTPNPFPLNEYLPVQLELLRCVSLFLFQARPFNRLIYFTLPFSAKSRGSRVDDEKCAPKSE